MDIAVRAMRGEIKPGGLPRHATIFFSDIRGFMEKASAFTKTFGEDAPNRIVLWLNDYYTHMIHCVEKTSGVVDKFIGDALMAHWGTVSSSGSPAEDAFNSVKAALMMREALLARNARRSPNDPGDPAIRIGCGINSGVVIAGQIGSEQRMEYTVIGDPVNIANRIESLNKLFRTDILISEETWKLTGSRFITEEMLPVTVKGMDKPVRVFAVINKKGADGPQTLKQLRALLGIGAPNINKIRIDEEEEKKYWLQGEKIKSEPRITMTSFGSEAWVQGPPGKSVPVFFSWNVSNFDSDTHIIVQVADDKSFTSIVEDRDLSGTLSVSVPLEYGLYWWRVYPAKGGVREPANREYPSGVLMVDKNAKVKIHGN
jgi:class 3 adenylate cyclase